jgi:hypothetical protein
MELVDFAQNVQDWHDFYMFVGAAAATLVGLLFVAVTLNISKYQQSSYGATRMVAYRTFYTFIYILFVAGVLLIPHQSPFDLGLPLLIISVIGIYHSVGNIVWVRRHKPSAGLSEEDTMRRLALVLASLVGLGVLSLMLLVGMGSALRWLHIVMLVLLFAATVNAWDMIMSEVDG